MNFLYPTSILGGIALLLAPTLAHGQNSPSPFYFGVRAGYSNYTMEGEEVKLHTQPGADELQRDQWFTVGAILRKRLYAPLSLQAELNYLREGGHFKGGVFLGKTVYTIDCLQIPLLLDVEVPATEQLSIHLQGGMALTTVVREVELDMPSFDKRNRFSNPTDFFSPVLGGELAWHQGRHVYFLNARYSYDLTDYYQREYMGTYYNAKSSGFTLAVGTLLGLGK
ncbi:porin family protein [Hymenobacter bucti]|uniref:Porin family protein n=1 Tax=Hymenobacter bucti TaxID=1844114 RepID=A0ABW4R238_9BACT